MYENDTAIELFRRVRGGDEGAAAELFRRYEATIRRRVRVWMRLQDPRLHRVFDSVDICQSVLASFFVRAAAGQYDLEHPGQLVNLLVRMAKHKLTHHVAHLHARRRDIRRTVAEDALDTVPATPPSTQLSRLDLLQQLLKQLSAEERLLAERRAHGRAWYEIAG
jgi:RNA polymerase sigma-70 factor (ECF subfamily)